MPLPSSAISRMTRSRSRRADTAMRPVAGLPASSRRCGRLDAVVHGVAQHVQERVGELLQDGPVELDLGARRPPPRPACPTLRATSRAARGSRSVTSGERRHAHRHDLVVQVLDDGVEPVDALVERRAGAAPAGSRPTSRMRAVARMSSPTVSRKSSRSSVRTRTVRGGLGRRRRRRGRRAGAAGGRPARRSAPRTTTPAEVGDLRERPAPAPASGSAVSSSDLEPLARDAAGLEVLDRGRGARPPRPSAGELLHHQEGAHRRAPGRWRRSPPRPASAPVRARPGGCGVGAAAGARRLGAGRAAAAAPGWRPGRRPGPPARGAGAAHRRRQRRAASASRATRAGSARRLAPAAAASTMAWSASPAASRSVHGAGVEPGRRPGGRRRPGPRPGGRARRCPRAASRPPCPSRCGRGGRGCRSSGRASAALGGAPARARTRSRRQAGRGARRPRTTKSARYLPRSRGTCWTSERAPRRRPGPSSRPRGRPRT